MTQHSDDQSHQGGFSQKIAEEVNEQIHPLAQKIQDNLKLIALVIGGIIVIAAAVTGYRQYKSATIQDARQRLSAVLAKDQEPEKIRALQDLLGDVPGELRPGVLLELAKASMERKSYSEAATYWKRVAAETGETNTRVVATLGRAKAMRLQGKPEASLDILTELARSAPDRYQRSINYEIAGAAEQAGKWKQALSAYRELKSATDITSGNRNYLQYKITELQQKASGGNS
jgi:predicted negative regulator of RcsB-dependent stress response